MPLLVPLAFVRGLICMLLTLVFGIRLWDDE